MKPRQIRLEETVKSSRYAATAALVLIEILTSPTCAHCETVKSRVQKVAEDLGGAVPNLTVKVINVVEHPEIALKYDALSTPAVAIDGELAFVGVPREKDIREKIIRARRV